MVEGFDSRYWDGTRPPAGLGAGFFYGKVHDGAWRPDNTAYLWLEHQRRACKWLKMPYGPYHYWHYSVDPIRQVDGFAMRIDLPELPPALDFEGAMPLGATDVGKRILAFVREFVKLGPLWDRPLVYTRASWWDKYVNSEQAAEIASLCDLWVANARFIPRGWTNWQIEQYTWDEAVPSVNAGVDRDRAKDDWYHLYVPQSG